MNRNSHIFVAGEKTMEGKAILNLFEKKGGIKSLKFGEPVNPSENLSL